VIINVALCGQKLGQPGFIRSKRDPGSLELPLAAHRDDGIDAPDPGRIRRRPEASEDGACSLTTGKLNAVRAAFKAGVKPSAIARQFGISQSDVRKALAQGTRREA
jgi:hypothetical protein